MFGKRNVISKCVFVIQEEKRVLLTRNLTCLYFAGYTTRVHSPKYWVSALGYTATFGESPWSFFSVLVTQFRAATEAILAAGAEYAR